MPSTAPSPSDGQVGDHADDLVDDLVGWWCDVNPDLDPTIKKVGMRLRRATHQFERILRREMAAHDGEIWEFEVLITLLRSEGHHCGAGDLQREAQLTSGAITNRIGRLEERGLVSRTVDPSDRRQVIVSLTEAGEARIRQLVAVKTSTDVAVFGRLDPDERAALEASLRQLMAILHEVEGGR